MFDKKKYDQQFAKDNYDRIALNVRKGEKAVIAEYAKQNGFDSITDYIKFVIYEDMNRHDMPVKTGDRDVMNENLGEQREADGGE